MSTRIIKISQENYIIISNDKYLTNLLRKSIFFKTGYLKTLKIYKEKIEHNSFVIYVLTNLEYDKYIGGTIYETN
jgi:hypothetical protein